jgi:hypothetical protein
MNYRAYLIKSAMQEPLEKEAFTPEMVRMLYEGVIRPAGQVAEKGLQAGGGLLKKVLPGVKPGPTVPVPGKVDLDTLKRLQEERLAKKALRKGAAVNVKLAAYLKTGAEQVMAPIGRQIPMKLPPDFGKFRDIVPASGGPNELVQAVRKGVPGTRGPLIRAATEASKPMGKANLLGLIARQLQGRRLAV